MTPSMALGHKAELIRLSYAAMISETFAQGSADQLDAYGSLPKNM